MEDEFGFLDQLTYTIQVGVVSGASKKRDKNQGVTNAELMFIHENGSPLRNIPSRPVLQMTIDYVNNKMLDTIIDKAIERYLIGGIEQMESEIKRYCMRIQTYARNIIYDEPYQLKANAPSTIRRKGFNHPLFVTGNLARSITCILRDKDGKRV